MQNRKHGTFAIDTQEKQAKIEQDIAVMRGRLMKLKAYLAQAEAKQMAALSAQVEAKTALHKAYMKPALTDSEQKALNIE